MPVTITTPHNVQLRYKPASLGDRILAYLLDSVIKIGYILLVGFLISLLADILNSPPYILIFLLVIPYIFYSLAFEYFMDGQTPGKRALKIQVATLQGYDTSAGQYILRWLFRMIDFQMSGLVAVISIAASNRSQRLGDMTAGTTVISLKQRVRLGSTIFQKVNKDHQVSYPDAVHLSTDSVQTIRECLQQGLPKHNPPLIKRMADRVASTIDIEYHEKPEDFLRTVLLDYNYMSRRQQNN